MKRNYANLFLILAAVGFVLLGCRANDTKTNSETKPETKSETQGKFPDTDEGTASFFKEFVKPGADHAALSKQLRPSKSDYEAFFKSDLVTKAASLYDPAWEGGQMVIVPGNAERTEVKIYSLKSDEVINWTKTAETNFAGGWKKIAPHIKSGVKIYEVKFVKPGETTGMRYDGVVNINGNWRIFPKPWRLVE